MKRILTIILTLPCFISMGQTGTFPNKHGQSTPKTNEIFEGAINPVKGIINGRYADTATANLGYIKGYKGALIVIGNSLWLRDTTSTRWMEVGTGTSTPSIQDGLISGGVVTYSGNGLTFDVTAALYVIGGRLFTSPYGQVTLSPSDATYSRWDQFVVDTNSVATKITGIAGVVPIVPQADPQSQIALTTGLRLNANDLVPPTVTSLIIYDENNAPPEWAVTNYTGITYDKDNATMPFSGTRDILVSSYTSPPNPALIFTGTSSQTVNADKVLKFRIKLTDTIDATNSMRVFFYGAGYTGSTILFKNAYGFRQDNIVDYQNVSIPFSSIASWSDTGFNRIVLYFYGINSSPFYIDRVELQSGLPNTLPQTDYSNKVDSSGNKKLTDSTYIGWYAVKGIKYYVGDTIKTSSGSGGSGIAVTSYGKNTGGDSTVLVLSDGTRYSAKDSVGTGSTGGGRYIVPDYGITVDSSDADKYKIGLDTTLLKHTTYYKNPLRAEGDTIKLNDTIPFILRYSPLVDTADIILDSNNIPNVKWILPRLSGGTPIDTTNKWVQEVVGKNDSTITVIKNGTPTDITLRFSGGTSSVKQEYTGSSTVTINDATTWLVINPASLAAAITITMPASPVDKQIIKISFGGSVTSGAVVTALTVAPNTGQSILGTTSFGTVEIMDEISLQYNSSNLKWYR